MTDSLQPFPNEGLPKRIKPTTPGRLHKGHNVVAANSSIPTKYQTIVIANADRRGFHSTAKRFNYDSVWNENPGPGTYAVQPLKHQDSVSFSKKGTGGFASKNKRVQRELIGFGPGPNYDITVKFRDKKDFNKAGCTGNFHNPIAVQKEKLGLPAPNQYEPKLLGRHAVVDGKAAFKSQTKRDKMFTGSNTSNPAPCAYLVKDNFTKPDIHVPCSSFKSTSIRNYIDRISTAPGPGTYHPHEPIESPEKTVFPKKHYLCISAPAMPLPPVPPQPGPGAYDMKDIFDVPKHYMSGAAFVSTTGRWTHDAKSTDLPGPAHYRPEMGNRQSFLYNALGRWV